MKLITVQQVADKLNVAVSYVWKLADKDPTFPKAVRLGAPDGPRRARVTRWVDEQLDEWIAGKQGEVDENRRVGSDVHQAAGENLAVGR